MIGIVGVPTRCRWAQVWERDVVMVPDTYLRAVTAAGGLAVVFAPSTLLLDAVPRMVAAVDGVVLVGGGDLDPSCYLGAADDRTGPTDPLRDEVEIAVARVCVETGVPLLGICRGMEVLNVARGGDLVQHVPDVTGTTVHLATPGVFERHPVRLTGGSRVAALCGSEDVVVDSHHHQAVGRLGAGLRVTGRAPDGIVEAVEAVEPAGAYAVGVQWHPEEDPGSTVISAFVDVVAARRG
ncbi:gamma-glutamyl-gamma-aminobutyrate hydrolase [Gordonia spumicola]|uniref:Gamma-glutamyl-gamma-aminobutyrate hydrolase n=1 Tax=Gordonia spumicola TaxID=589161 RepID=A0A7I9VF00_9ACTN|nr:gamma-glutamyl-gamma-aminobutyrate hydrolase family protein [Gordonia spumicola]GEE03886.1 gamma-glutamyl-gamma-aminobutyrate hydrolase [Gordonia spumicola]